MINHKASVTFFAVPEGYIQGTIKFLRWHEIPFEKFSGMDAKLEISLESKLNYSEVDFNPLIKEDIRLLRQLKVFEYWHKHKDNFSISSCCYETNISNHFVSKIVKKYGLL